MSEHIVIVGSRRWNRKVLERLTALASDSWTFIDRPHDLTEDGLRRLDPRYVFFLHWTSKVPSNITESFECVGFHMTDLPYGRGGTPLQNLILSGHRSTKLTAFRLTDELDAGPIYLKADLSLDGSAQQIYERADRLSTDMIQRLVRRPVLPQPQVGEPTLFERRTPEQSELPEAAALDQIYDWIRMLDAEGYPHAFVDHGPHRIEFRNATRSGDALTASVHIVTRST